MRSYSLNLATYSSLKKLTISDCLQNRIYRQHNGNVHKKKRVYHRETIPCTSKKLLVECPSIDDTKLICFIHHYFLFVCT